MHLTARDYETLMPLATAARVNVPDAILPFPAPPGQSLEGQPDHGVRARMTPAHATDGRSDFDFLHGTWDVLNRKLRRPLTDPSDWEVFATTAEARPILQGLGNFDRFTRAARPGAEAWEGCTLRLFDPETAEWIIHWASTRQPGRLDPPLRGRFVAGVGEFHGSDTFAGRPIRVRFYWKDITPASAVWQQAFSHDDGATWETNWVMRFTRAR